MCARLAEDVRREWCLYGDQGIVHLHSYMAYMPFNEGLRDVQRAGSDLVDGLSGAAESMGLPPIPAFTN